MSESDRLTLRSAAGPVLREAAGERSEDRPWLSWVVMLVLLAVALALRWHYIQEISLFVDEFVTAWAAQNVLLRGFPSFPSGNIYPHGFVFTYLVAPFVQGQFDETLARIPALIISLAALPVVFLVGRRLFSAQTGLVAAAVMAVDPAQIVWGGRVRMYGLLQLLTLLVIYFFYRGMAEDRARDRYLAMLLLVLAVFTHAEAAFLIPILGLAALVISPWRRLFRWSVILPFAIASLGALIFYVISKYGQPGHLETLQESRPYLDISVEALRLTGPQAFAPVFASLHRLPLTLLAIAGVYFVFRPRFERSAPLTYLYVVFVAFSLLLVVLAGAGWQRERYIFMMMPVFFLIGAEVLTRVVAYLPLPAWARSWQGPVLTGLVALFVGLTGAPTAYVQVWGYDRAFHYLREQWQPESGDQVATSMSTAAMLYLGHNDAFAIQQGYEEYVVARPGDGLPSDLWTASPIITTTAEMADFVRGAPRAWFVTDSWRFQTRYDPDFVMTVLEHMEPVYNERGVMVFRSAERKDTDLSAIARAWWADFGGEIALVGFSLSSTNPDPGDELQVTLHWQALDGAGPAYVALLHLVRPGGVGEAGLDEQVMGGFYQPDLWPDGSVVSDSHPLMLPADLPPGQYRLDLGLYPPQQPGAPLLVDGFDRVPLATLQIGDSGSPPPSAEQALADLGPISLLDFDLQYGSRAAEDQLQVTLHWQATAPMEQDYTVFVHLVGPTGEILVQGDGPPGDPFFPTSTWLPGDGFLDEHVLDLPPDIPPGEYMLLTGVYHQPSGVRLLATDSDGTPLGDGVSLTSISLGPDLP